MMVRKLKGVAFDMSDPVEKELCEFVERQTDDFSSFIKQLLFSWIHGEREKRHRSPLEDQGEAIRNSGLPFG